MCFLYAQLWFGFSSSSLCYVMGYVYFSWNLLCLLFLSFYNKTFWYDEAYSIGLIDMSFKDIWNTTALDVHPPLYYYILKVFTFIFGHSVTSFHLCSLLGVLALYLMGDSL